MGPEMAENYCAGGSRWDPGRQNGCFGAWWVGIADGASWDENGVAGRARLITELTAR